MIPIQLTIEGLYSYQERQTINFNDLIDAGLFGIFGAVGSGKSSILEAISYVLYGVSDRLGATKMSYNMMNLKSNRSYVEFDFLNFENKLFRITREYKRNSKQFDVVRNPTVVFYENIKEEWVPLDHTNSEKILGLSYENFRRTIIIPQGQFKEFIELKPTARTQMMKEIFNLHKYDLQDNAARLAKDNLAELNKIEGKLQGFETISLESIEENQNNLKVEEDNYTVILNNYNDINENFQRLKALKSDFETLKTKKIQFEQIKVQKEQKDKEQLQLDQYELIFNAFNQLLIDQFKLEKEIQENKISLENQKKQGDLIENHIKEITLQIQAIQKDFDGLAEKRVEENDLNLIIQILAYTEEIKNFKARTLKGIAKVEEVKQNQKQIEDQIRNSVAQLKEISLQRLDPQVLMAVDNWFVKNETIQNSIKAQSNKIEQIKAQIALFQKRFSDEKITISTFEADFIALKEVFVKQKNALENQKNECEVQQKLAQYAHNLHDGESCPLCGSLDHPQVVVMDDVKSKIEKIKEEILQLEKEQEKEQNRFTEIKQLIYQNQLIEEQIIQENRTLDELNKQLKEHKNLFIWQDFDSSNFEGFKERKHEVLKIEKEIEDKNNFISSQREVLEKARAAVEKYKIALDEFKLEEAKKAAQIKQNLSNLKVLKFEDFENLTVIEVENNLKELKAFNLKIEKDYLILQQNLNDFNLKLAAQKSTIQLLDIRIETQNSEFIQVENSIQTALLQSKIEDLEQVKIVLNQKLDIVSLRKQLEEFRIQFKTLNNSIQELEQKLAKVSFDDETYLQQEAVFNQITSQLKDANELVINRKTEIARLLQAYEAKKEILEVQNKLQKRAELLKLFGNMFKGAGFVQYVSSIYLKQLCENANVRFHRMTRNQLSLQINENHEFEIIDYLNEGRPRSVKTLSGGQAFQVSLSLALALAESVQTNLKASKNFFFIDEGFGTQDADAVNIVFETLNHLHKENRIVGIISHVEELKERIPMALNITKDEEKGSCINML